MNYIKIQNIKLNASYEKVKPLKYVKYDWIYKKMMLLLDYLTKYDKRMTKQVIKQSFVTSESVSKLCLESFSQAYRETGKPPKLLIIGCNEWYELTNEMAFNFRGVMPIDLYFRDGNKKSRFNGIEVQIVPYINGAFCLPDIN